MVEQVQPYITTYAHGHRAHMSLYRSSGYQYTVCVQSGLDFKTHYRKSSKEFNRKKQIKQEANSE